MQIKLNQGVDEILFGMTEDNIIAALGNPDKIVITDYGNREIIYNSLKLVLKIEFENEKRLGWIEVRNRQAKWLGVDPWKQKRETLLELLSKNLGDSYELDDYGELESYSFKKNWIELQYELGELTSFNFGVRYDENNKPLWP